LEKTNVDAALETIIGMIVGAVAKLLVLGRDPGGISFTMILGIAGSIVVTYLGIWVSLLVVPGRAGSGLHLAPRWSPLTQISNIPYCNVRGPQVVGTVLIWWEAERWRLRRIFLEI
jgi:uncharacterized membrane protein YeaQ/YmgE (transglycosylase-associated protein family)